MAKLFTYRGKKLEELQALTLEQFMELLPSRQRRTLKRGLTRIEQKFLASARKAKGTEKLVRTKCRDVIVFPDIVGVKVGVYDGKQYQTLTIIPEMIGRRLGEFALTRKRVQHGQPGFGATRGSKFVPLK